jgi:hypothetical protein
MSSIEPRTISRPWPSPKRFSWRLLPPLDHRARLDAALKIFIPLALLVLLVLALKWGSFGVYLELLQSRTYTSVLPALGAGYTVLLLLLQGLRTALWACYRPTP